MTIYLLRVVMGVSVLLINTNADSTSNSNIGRVQSNEIENYQESVKEKPICSSNANENNCRKTSNKFAGDAVHSPLHHAAMKNDYQEIRNLLNRGVTYSCPSLFRL